MKGKGGGREREKNNDYNSSMDYEYSTSDSIFHVIITTVIVNIIVITVVLFVKILRHPSLRRHPHPAFASRPGALQRITSQSAAFDVFTRR